MRRAIRFTRYADLERLALIGEHGKPWYDIAGDACAGWCWRNNVDLVHFVAILALLSPQMPVWRNVKVAKQYMAAVKEHGSEVDTHRHVPGLMIKTHRRACEIYEATGHINGLKTSAFASAILGDDNAVVLDTHMATALNVPAIKLTKNKGIFTEACKRVRQVARKLGWTPAETQAAIWTAVYESKHRPEHETPGIEHYLYGDKQ